MYVLWNRYLDQYYIINSLMDNVFVRYLLPFNFIIASIKDGSQLWSFMISFYAGVILLVYGNWFVKNKKLKDGYWKIERQVIWTGLGVYGIINVLIWMFTHFSFVGGNYLYMETTIKYVDQIVAVYDRDGQKDHFALKDLKYFETRQQMLDYYKDPLFTKAAGVVDRQGFYDVSMDIMGKFNTNLPGHNIDNNLSYKNMIRFHDWMSVVMNMKYLGEDTTQKTAWTIELAPIIRVDPKYQDVTRHAIMYVKESKDGHFYSYFVFDRVFKDFKQNYIFNLFFGLFHVVFIPLFIYLVYLHKRKNLQKSSIVKEMKYLD